MRQDVSISLVESESNVSIPFKAEFYDKGMKIGITNMFRVIMDRELTTSEKLLSHHFSPQSRFLNISWDDQKEKDKDDAIKMLMRHLMILGVGYINPNLTKPIFKLENKGKSRNLKAAAIKEKGRAFNIANDFTFAQLRDVAFWYGENATKMTPEDVFIKLLDFENGVIMKKPVDFINRYKSPDIQYNVVINKAIMLDIIKKDKGFYWIEQEQIGASLEDVMAYCKINDKMYSGYIVEEVKKKDKLPVDWNEKVGSFMEEPVTKTNLDKFKDVNQVKEEKTLEKSDYEKSLRYKAKEMGIKAYAIKKIDTLEKEIAATETPKVQEGV